MNCDCIVVIRVCSVVHWCISQTISYWLNCLLLLFHIESYVAELFVKCIFISSCIDCSHRLIDECFISSFGFILTSSICYEFRNAFMD